MGRSAPPRLSPSTSDASEGDASAFPSLNISPGAVIGGGKYRLKEPLRQGGMGSVWVATHLALDTPVAVKFMLTQTSGTKDASEAPVSAQGPKATPMSSTSVESRGRFEREAKAVAQIRSANVVQILDYGVDHGAQYIVMELLHGEDLGSHLKRRIRMPLEEVSRLVVAIARALQRAHDVGLVHRDLKPPNVFLAREGDEMVPKVLDFGVAKTVHDRPVGEGTLEGTLVGTPSYMSPEQAMGRSALDHRADLWSLGVIVYRAITGVRPFESESLLELVVQICSHSPVPPTKRVPGLPPAIDEFIARALDRDPSKRFQSAREMARALVAIAPPRSSVPPVAGDLGSGAAGARAEDATMIQIAMPDSADDIMTVMVPSEVSPDVAVSNASPKSDPHIASGAHSSGQWPALSPGADLQSASVDAAAPAPARPPVRRVVVVGAVIAFLSLAVVGALLIRASRSNQGTAGRQAELSAPSAMVPSVTVPSAALTAITAASTTPAIEPAVPASASSAPPSPSAKVQARTQPTAKAVDCSTPFYWDRNGTKFIKPQCL